MLVEPLSNVFLTYSRLSRHSTARGSIVLGLCQWHSTARGSSTRLVPVGPTKVKAVSLFYSLKVPLKLK